MPQIYMSHKIKFSSAPYNLKVYMYKYTHHLSNVHVMGTSNTISEWKVYCHGRTCHNFVLPGKKNIQEKRRKFSSDPEWHDHIGFHWIWSIQIYHPYYWQRQLYPCVKRQLKNCVEILLKSLTEWKIVFASSHCNNGNTNNEKPFYFCRCSGWKTLFYLLDVLQQTNGNSGYLGDLTKTLSN